MLTIFLIILFLSQKINNKKLHRMTNDTNKLKLPSLKQKQDILLEEFFLSILKLTRERGKENLKYVVSRIMVLEQLSRRPINI